MKNAFSLHLGLLLATLLIAATGVFWTVDRSWNQITGVEQQLTAQNLESFRLADSFQRRLLDLNNAMLRYAVRGEPTEWKTFEQSSQELDHWIDRYDLQSGPQSRPITARERQLLRQLNTAYDDYLVAAKKVHSTQQPLTISAERLKSLSEFEAHGDELLNLGLDLATAHRAAEESFIRDANASLTTLRMILNCGVSFILGLIAVLGFVFYRDMIAPLRTKLVESQVLLEKQGKLATLGTLAAGIAHEVRNPLTSIKARLYTLNKHLENPALARTDAEIISSEIGRLERIVQEVLKFARPAEPKMQVVRADQPLREVETLMKSTLEKSGISLVFETGPELHVGMDTALIKQVLINLVGNASEAISGKGTVTLRTRSDRLQLNGQMKDVAILEVSDTGKGIPPEVEKNLFEPFFTTKESGTGLGLAIAARIVEKHGGTLRYQTRVGYGTTFGIVLPITAADKVDRRAA